MSEIKSKHDVVSAQSMYVVKSNTLIQKSRYSLTLMEQKVVLFIISKIKPQDKADTTYTFSLSDFVKTCNLSNEVGYYTQYLRNAMTELGKEVITIEVEKGKTLISHWFSSAFLDENTNTFTVTFDNYIRPYLFELKNFYTQYSLEYILPMQSKYSIRLYEFLRSTKTLGISQRYEIEEIKKRIDCTTYDYFKDFRVNVIDPALRDINAYTDLEVAYIPRKTGKKVTHIDFIIKDYQDDENTLERFYNRRKKLGSVHGE